MDRITELTEALESANDICRSAMSIAKREGKETDWNSFKARLDFSLKLQQSVLYPK